MYTRRFFQTKLGQAAAASISAMVAFALMNTMMPVAPDFKPPVSEFDLGAPIIAGIVELA